MFAGFTEFWLVVILAVIAFGGLVKGLAGFGYAIASTAVLATLVAPSTAVVIMIVPTLAANLSLLGELDRESVRACVRRFWPYVLAAVVGTLAGMALLDRVPTRPLAAGLGAFTLVYAGFKQDAVVVPGQAWLARRCFTEGRWTQPALGLVSGLIFGASNVGVQVVAYLDSLDLDRSTFVGVLAMILVGVSTIRVGAAAALGLYDSTDLLLLSVAAAVPGIAGVAAGGRLRERAPDRAVSLAVLVLLGIIGVRLLLKGLAGV